MNALGGVQFFLVAPGIDANSFDVFHDDIRATVFSGAAVEEAGYVGMIEGSDDLAFATEALDDAIRFDALVDDFDGDEFVVGFVGAGGEIDGSHATASEEFLNGIGTDLFGHRFVHFGGSIGEDFGEGSDGRFFEEIVGG